MVALLNIMGAWQRPTERNLAVTLRWRLTLAFVLVVLVPLLVGAALVLKALPGAVQQQQAWGLASNARLTAQILQGYCDQARSTAEAAGRAAGTVDVAGVRVAATSLVSQGLADGLRISGPTGAVVAKVGQLADPPVDCNAGSPVSADISAVVQLRTAAGRVAGSSVASFNLGGRRLDGLQKNAGATAIVLLAQGRPVAGGRNLDPKTLRAAVAHASSRSDGVLTAYAAPQPGQPFGVVLVATAGQGPDVLIAAVVLGAVLLAGLLAFGLARVTTRPLEELGTAAARVASGDLGTVIEVRSQDEVGRLAGAFATMTEDLRDYVGQLETSRDDLQAGLARLGDTLSSTHDLDRILHVVLESAMVSTRASGGMLLLLNPSRDQLVLSASRGLEVPLDLVLPVGHGVSGQVAQAAEPVRGRIGHGPGELAPAPGEPSDTSFIAVPLMSSGAVVGVLDLFGSASGEGFDERDLATIRTFASQATVAVNNVLLHEEAQRLSITDALTGLWNYRYFTLTIGKEIERATRFERPLSLLMLDLDHFKTVNDTFGHPRGDAVLIELAKRIKSQVRDVDTVARYGGEEVVIILPETDDGGAVQAAERIRSIVGGSAFGSADEAPITVTVSIGVAVFPQHGASATTLLARADEALYDAKRAGRDTARVAASAPVVKGRH